MTATRSGPRPFTASSRCRNATTSSALALNLCAGVRLLPTGEAAPAPAGPVHTARRVERRPDPEPGPKHSAARRPAENAGSAAAAAACGCAAGAARLSLVLLPTWGPDTDVGPPAVVVAAPAAACMGADSDMVENPSGCEVGGPPNGVVAGVVGVVGCCTPSSAVVAQQAVPPCTELPAECATTVLSGPMVPTDSLMSWSLWLPDLCLNRPLLAREEVPETVTRSRGCAQPQIAASMRCAPVSLEGGRSSTSSVTPENSAQSASSSFSCTQSTRPSSTRRCRRSAMC
mmetsp:Transcript_26597/g.67747  ORF Transcript_26597/g.67747 Transcript_26597/m.67747 type:complete len:287 (-) Transcript_26597:2511-3371(-)